MVMVDRQQTVAELHRAHLVRKIEYNEFQFIKILIGVIQINNKFKCYDFIIFEKKVVYLNLIRNILKYPHNKIFDINKV